MQQVLLSDAIPDLENADRLVPHYRERIAQLRRHIFMSFETIAMANGKSREEARAEPLIQKAYQACDSLETSVQQLEESARLVRAWIAEHPELLSQKPWPHIWQKCGNLHTIPRSLERNLAGLTEALG
jgi:hypothetical protein